MCYPKSTPPPAHVTLHSYLHTSRPHQTPRTFPYTSRPIQMNQNKSTAHKNSGPPLTIRNLTRGGGSGIMVLKNHPPPRVVFLFLRTPPPPQKPLTTSGGSGIPLFIKKTTFSYFCHFCLFQHVIFRGRFWENEDGF
jgi:hypothetical protein